MNAPSDGGQDDIVHRAAERLLDRAEHSERALGGREPAVRTDLAVERPARRGPHPGHGAERVRAGGERFCKDPGLAGRVSEALDRVEQDLADRVTDQILRWRRGLR